MKIGFLSSCFLRSAMQTSKRQQSRAIALTSNGDTKGGASVTMEESSKAGLHEGGVDALQIRSLRGLPRVIKSISLSGSIASRLKSPREIWLVAILNCNLHTVSET
jgi:hypothetical protein